MWRKDVEWPQSSMSQSGVSEHVPLAVSSSTSKNLFVTASDVGLGTKFSEGVSMTTEVHLYPSLYNLDKYKQAALPCGKLAMLLD